MIYAPKCDLHPKNGAQHTLLKKKKSCGVGSCALNEIDARSLLRHRARWWYQGPQVTTACCVSYIYILVYSLFLLTLSHLSSRYLCLGSRLVCFAAEGARTKRGRTEHRAKRKLNNRVAGKKSRRELTERAGRRKYENDRWWMIMKHETSWKMCRDFST